MFLEATFSRWRKLFPEFQYKIFVIALHDIIGLKNSHCFSANHNPELRCAIYTGVTLFGLVLHLNCTALSQSDRVFFFMCIITINTGRRLFQSPDS